MRGIHAAWMNGFCYGFAMAAALAFLLRLIGWI